MLAKLVQLGPLPDIEFKTSSNLSIPDMVQTLNPYWISGFATGEGSCTYFTRSRENSTGKAVKDYTLVFEISQRTQDLHILNLIASYFKVGNVYTGTNGISRYRLATKDKIISTLAPHFKNYSLVGNKALQYEIINTCN